MLRFAVITTSAMFLGTLAALALLLTLAALAYALGAASRFSSHQRASGFVGACVILALSAAVALFSPVVLLTLTIWKALR